MQKRVAVFFGGNSNEHEISVITGMLAVNLLKAAEYDVLPVYLPREGGMVTGEYISVKDVTSLKKPVKLRWTEGGLACERGRKTFPLYAALNCCHGGAGENGTLSSLLQWYRIRSASPAAAISAVFMDKTLSKIALKGLGVPVLESVSLSEEEGLGSCAEKAAALGFPLILKPANLGSSIGIRVVKEAEGLYDALRAAFQLDGKVLAEKYLAGKRDLNCAVCRVGGKIKVSPVEEALSGEILSFSDKYEGTDRRRSVFPAQIPDGVSQRVQALTALVYESFGGRGVVRADFLYDGENVYFNELNTVPGSLAYYLFGDSLSEARDFLVSLVEEADGGAEKPTLATGLLNDPLFTGKGKRR